MNKLIMFVMLLGSFTYGQTFEFVCVPQNQFHTDSDDPHCGNYDEHDTLLVDVSCGELTGNDGTGYYIQLTDISDNIIKFASEVDHYTENYTVSPTLENWIREFEAKINAQTIKEIQYVVDFQDRVNYINNHFDIVGLLNVSYLELGGDDGVGFYIQLDDLSNKVTSEVLYISVEGIDSEFMNQLDYNYLIDTTIPEWAEEFYNKILIANSN